MFGGSPANKDSTAELDRNGGRKRRRVASTFHGQCGEIIRVQKSAIGKCQRWGFKGLNVELHDGKGGGVDGLLRWVEGEKMIVDLWRVK